PAPALALKAIAPTVNAPSTLTFRLAVSAVLPNVAMSPAPLGTIEFSHFVVSDQLPAASGAQMLATLAPWKASRKSLPTLMIENAAVPRVLEALLLKKFA